jgi:hypothetical protein
MKKAEDIKTDFICEGMKGGVISEDLEKICTFSI